MPIVINEFEIVSEPPPAASTQSVKSEPEPTAQPPGWMVRDMAEIFERSLQRAARVRAD
jgi:hypothetical protein